MSNEPDLVQVQITVNITFDANGEDHEWLRANAHKAISREFGNGGITGGSDAVVEEYDIEAVIVKEKSPSDSPAAPVSPSHWMAAGAKSGEKGLDPDVRTQRDLLASAIREAAVKRGIWTAVSSEGARGPDLLMVLNDLVSEPTLSPLSEAATTLDENTLRDYLTEQIEGGHMGLGEISKLMARYALADPREIREEMAERMENFKAENADYIVGDHWGHIFAGNSETATRWVIKRGVETLIFAQLKTNQSWQDMSADEAKDLAESLTDNNVLTDFAIVKCEEDWTADSGAELTYKMPEWVKASSARTISIPVVAISAPAEAPKP